MRPASTKASPEELIAELGRSQEELAAAERRARTYLAAQGILDQTERDVRALVRDAAETGNTAAPETV
jgi:hypothetical protein